MSPAHDNYHDGNQGFSHFCASEAKKKLSWFSVISAIGENKRFQPHVWKLYENRGSASHCGAAATHQSSIFYSWGSLKGNGPGSTTYAFFATFEHARGLAAMLFSFFFPGMCHLKSSCSWFQWFSVAQKWGVPLITMLITHAQLSTAQSTFLAMQNKSDKIKIKINLFYLHFSSLVHIYRQLSVQPHPSGMIQSPVK